MPWVRLDDGFADHPKVERAGPLAAWLHVVAMCYCARHLTDGRIPKATARRLADIPSPGRHIDTLVAVGLWDEDGDDYVLHDFLEYQPSRADVEADRKAARERMANARRNKSRSSPEHPPNEARSSDNPDPARPLSIETKGGENLRAAAAELAPPRRCPVHADTDGQVPPCGACAEARRTLEAWNLEHGNGASDEFDHRLDDQQQAALARAQAGMAQVHSIVAEPVDPGRNVTAARAARAALHPNPEATA